MARKRVNCLGEELIFLVCDLFTCPVCALPLREKERTYRCEAGHCFDIARRGYVNLLLGKTSGQHGDNREMIEARRDFLSAGHYAPLADKIAEIGAKELPQDATVLDAGCGECYYTARLAEEIRKCGKNAAVVGVDVSKEALTVGARRDASLALAVGSVYKMPFAEASFDLVLSVFAPYAGEEFLRILKPNGRFLMVIPRERHLFGMKEVLYERPYENKPEDTAIDGFTLLSDTRVEYTLTLTDPTDIGSLFRMTPYYYRTSQAGREKLDRLANLTTEVAFSVLLYKKIQKHF